MNDVWQKAGAIAAGGGTVLAWARSIDSGLVATSILVITGAVVIAYRQIAAVRLEAEVARIREIKRAETDAHVEALERIAELHVRIDGADMKIEEASVRIDRNATAVGDLKDRLKDAGVIDGSDPD